MCLNFYFLDFRTKFCSKQSSDLNCEGNEQQVPQVQPPVSLKFQNIIFIAKLCFVNSKDAAIKYCKNHFTKPKSALENQN